MANVSADACHATHKSLKWLIGILYGAMLMFMGMVGYAIAAEHAAVDAASQAQAVAERVAADMEVHEARQNGSLKNIESQLNTLRTYHSTLRGDTKDNREILDELLRHAGNHPSPSE